MTTLLSFCTFILIFWTTALHGEKLTVEDSGGWSGNGGGPNRVQDNVWYLGQEPVRYCVKVAPLYPLSYTEAQSMMQRSLQAWQMFFQKYQIGHARTPNPALQDLAMSLRFVEVSCSQAAELEVHFGEENETIRLYREMHESDGLGLAVRRSYDHHTHRHQGYIWLQNFTRDPRRIEHMLLHELGHVFGMKHDTVFVMDGRVALWLERMKPNDPAVKFLSRIEADFWPFDLLPGSRIRLVPYARQLPRSGSSSFSQNCRSGSLSLDQIPLDFQPPVFPLSGCVNLHLQKNREGDLWNFQLEISQESGPLWFPFFGAFLPSEPGNTMPLVPGTQSNFQNLGRTPAPWSFVPYGQHSMHARLSGYFIRGQTRYPAKLSWDDGLTLEIFIPDQGRWWSIRSFSDAG
jgi:hypothetical protein